MYVEFIGASGAGKTTIVEKTVEILNVPVAHVVTRKSFFNDNQKRNKKILWTFLCFWRMDIRMVYFLWCWGRCKGFKNAGMKTHEYIKLRYVISNTATDSVTLWDSGFVQLFSKLVVTGFVSKEVGLEMIQKRLPKVCLLVFLDTSIEEAIERKRGRAIEWGSQATIDQLEKRIADEEVMRNTHEVQNMQKWMLEELKTKQMNVVTLNGLVPPEENAALLAQMIKQETYV